MQIGLATAAAIGCCNWLLQLAAEINCYNWLLQLTAVIVFCKVTASRWPCFCWLPVVQLLFVLVHAIKCMCSFTLAVPSACVCSKMFVGLHVCGSLFARGGLFVRAMARACSCNRLLLPNQARTFAGI